MQKKDIAEIKKSLKLNNQFLTINKVISSLIWDNKEVKYYQEKNFLNLDFFEQEYLLNISKKILNGKVGKNNIEYDFAIDWFEDKDSQSLKLYEFNKDLKNTKDYIYFIAENFSSAEPYFLNVINCSYDIPIKKGKQCVASGNIFNFSIFSFAELKHEKPVLIFDEKKEAIRPRTFLDMTLKESPFCGFMYPLFTNYETDVNGLLFYINNQYEPPKDFIEDFLGCQNMIEPKKQESLFNSVLLQTFGEEAKLETINSINDKIRNKIIDNNKDKNGSRKTTSLNKKDFINILTECEVEDEIIETFAESYDNKVGKDNFLVAESIINEDKSILKTRNMKIDVNSKVVNNISTEIINGRKCIVIDIDENVELDGINVIISK